MIDDEMNLYN